MSALVDALLSTQPGHIHPPPAEAVTGLAPPVLLALPFAAGFALLRPFLAAPGRGTRELVSTATAGAVLWEAFRLPDQTPRVLSLALAAVALLVPVAVALGRSTRARTDTVLPWMFSACAVTAVLAFHDAWFGEGGSAEVAVLCGFACLAWYPLCSTRSRGGAIVIRSTAAVLALALIGGVAQVAITGANGPKPGVPVLARITVATTALDVVIVPHLPGPNLVHVTPARNLPITSDIDTATTDTRPGSDGGWAVITLPEGKSTLHLGDSPVPVDTGDTVADAPDLTGADGPECESALLGALIGKPTARRDTSPCPAEALTSHDAAALRTVPAFLAGRGQRMISLVADDSPRSRAAERTVREAAEAHGVGITDDPTAPVVVVSGWQTAAATVAAVAAGDHPAQGSYLAPWLVTPPLLKPPAGQVVPLAFTPTDESPMRYLSALADRASGAAPSTSGYQAWLRAQGGQPATTVRLHAASTATIPGSNHHDHRPSWLPGGAVLPVTGPLDPG